MKGEVITFPDERLEAAHGTAGLETQLPGMVATASALWGLIAEQDIDKRPKIRRE